MCGARCYATILATAELRASRALSQGNVRGWSQLWARGAGPITSSTLAQRTGTTERYVREWLGNQAAGGYVVYNPADSTYELPAEWLPALDGVAGKLRAGASVADVGCGLGASTVIMAQAFQRSTFVGFDIHEPSIQAARKAAAQAGVSKRARFDVAAAKDFPGQGYDLVCLFDALHDMGDPVGAARRIRQALAPDGTLLLVEPNAGDALEHNLNPVGRTYYGLSTVICTPGSLAQDVGLGLGAQAGERQLAIVLREAGFTHVRRATETPFNIILEARP